jgi:hypothetical protein
MNRWLIPSVVFFVAAVISTVGAFVLSQLALRPPAASPVRALTDVEAAILRDGNWIDDRLKVHAARTIGPGMSSDPRLRGEAVVEVWDDERRFLCVACLVETPKDGTRWRLTLNPCLSRSLAAHVTSNPTPIELGNFQSVYRMARGLSPADDLRQETTFHFGFSGK